MAEQEPQLWRMRIAFHHMTKERTAEVAQVIDEALVAYYNKTSNHQMKTWLNPSPLEGGKFYRDWMRPMNTEIEPCPQTYDTPSGWEISTDPTHTINKEETA